MNPLQYRWEQFWFAPIPPHIYALLRIAFGLVGCGTLFGLRDLSMFWFLDGLVPLHVGAVGLKQYLIAHGLGHAAGAVLYVVTSLSFVAMTIGFQTRIAVPAALFTSLIQVAWNYLPLSGADAAMRVFLFCLVWAECGSVWSIDAWLAGRRNVDAPPTASETTSIAPLRLIRFQVSLIYLSAGIWKIFNPYWRDGSAVHYVVQSNVYRRLPHGMPLAFDQVVSVLTYSTLAWELSFGLLLLFAATRRIAILAGILLHLGMLLTIEIGPFHYVMLASYLAFLDPDAVPQLSYRLETMVRRRPRVPARVEPAASR
jgi:vitamin K-dependent gamma-carboxylase-like protein